MWMLINCINVELIRKSSGLYISIFFLAADAFFTKTYQVYT